MGVGLLGGSHPTCKLYWELCRRAEPARRAYYSIVEPVMGYSRSGELAAALGAARNSGDCASACQILEYLSDRISGEDVCIAGPIPRGECRGVRIAVEGAILTRPGDVMEAAAIVGDLDTAGAPTVELCTRRRPCLVHVHGDNYPSVIPVLGRGWILATSQAFCVPPVLGVGGFTDGDRAVIVAMLFGARRVRIVGFDWDRVFLGHKRPSGVAGVRHTKRVKLEVSRLVIERVAKAMGYVWAGRWGLERLISV